MPKLYLDEWMAGGCILCGSPGRETNPMAHEVCWKILIPDYGMSCRVLEVAHKHKAKIELTARNKMLDELVAAIMRG
jgi:hypothetical protein